MNYDLIRPVGRARVQDTQGVKKPTTVTSTDPVDAVEPAGVDRAAPNLDGTVARAYDPHSDQAGYDSTNDWAAMAEQAFANRSPQKARDPIVAIREYTRNLSRTGGYFR